MFQSAPLTEARGDPQGRPQSTCVAGFNPLPSPKQGETRDATRCLPFSVSFQSAPLTEARGDFLLHYFGVYKKGVSIRSPHRSKGRQGGTNDEQNLITFQSAPLTEARGDPFSQTTTAPMACFNPLPSPKQGETEALGDIDVTLNVSIRSPHRSKGRHRSL